MTLGAGACLVSWWFIVTAAVTITEYPVVAEQAVVARLAPHAAVPWVDPWLYSEAAHGYTLKLGLPFSDGMVLRREAHNCFWGTAPVASIPNAVSITLSSNWEMYVVARNVSVNGSNGDWHVCMKAPRRVPWNASFRLSVRDAMGAPPLMVHAISFGDVFLCSGQSST
jgi:hypothetical protein